LLSAKRDVSAAKRFFKKVMRGDHRRVPFSISVDKNASYPDAFTFSQAEKVLHLLALLSAPVVALPVVVLLGLLAFFHVKAHVAAIAGLAVSMLTGVSVYGMPVRLTPCPPPTARPSTCAVHSSRLKAYLLTFQPFCVSPTLSRRESTMAKNSPQYRVKELNVFALFSCLNNA
jgi:hypothetical protein